MKLGIISDSPLLTTGFGVEAYQVASALAEAGHDVVCFGLKGRAGDKADGIFRVWNVDPASRWDLLLKRFFRQEQPEKLIILIDLFNLREIITYCQAAAWSGTTILYLTPDGLPAYDVYIDLLRQVDHCVVTTKTCKQYLSSCDIPVWGIAPPGVDAELFKPLPYRNQLRQAAGLADRFVVGVFGRNCERKQQPRVLQALANLADPEVVVYFHCQKRGYWHLDELAHELGVADQVIFAELKSELQGIAYIGCSLVNANNRPNRSALQMPPGYGYIERINCCDLIINATHCGDFEHIIIEAQACGVPLAHTHDGGIMTEAVGNGGLLLRSLDVSWGRIGQRIYLVDPQAIAEAIRSVKQDPALRQQLQQCGLDNVKQYRWSHLRETMVQLVETPA